MSSRTFLALLEFGNTYKIARIPFSLTYAAAAVLEDTLTKPSQHIEIFLIKDTVQRCLRTKSASARNYHNDLLTTTTTTEPSPCRATRRHHPPLQHPHHPLRPPPTLDVRAGPTRNNTYTQQHPFLDVLRLHALLPRDSPSRCPPAPHAGTPFVVDRLSIHEVHSGPRACLFCRCL